MNEKIRIKITIGNRVYPLTIKGEDEEEGIRAAVDKINKLIKKFEENYAVRDKQDVLAMCRQGLKIILSGLALTLDFRQAIDFFSVFVPFAFFAKDVDALVAFENVTAYANLCAAL